MGQRLKELRERGGLTQEGLARAADVTLGAVRKWERGTRTPSFDMAVRLADALAVSLDELAGRAAEAPGEEEVKAGTAARKEEGPAALLNRT